MLQPRPMTISIVIWNTGVQCMRAKACANNDVCISNVENEIKSALMAPISLIRRWNTVYTQRGIMIDFVSSKFKMINGVVVYNNWFVWVEERYAILQGYQYQFSYRSTVQDRHVARVLDRKM